MGRGQKYYAAFTPNVIQFYFFDEITYKDNTKRWVEKDKGKTQKSRKSLHSLELKYLN